MAYRDLLQVNREYEPLFNNVYIMNELQKNSNRSLLEIGIDVMKDPKSSTAAKAGAIGIVAIGAIVYVIKATLDTMKNK